MNPGSRCDGPGVRTNGRSGDTDGYVDDEGTSGPESLPVQERNVCVGLGEVGEIL